MSPASQTVAEIRQALEPLADPARAHAMRAYMRDRFDFLGIAAPVRRAAVAALGRRAPTHAELLRTVRALWRLPAREYRYTAIDWLRRHRAVLGPDDVAELLALALHEPWWDTVDGLAAVIGAVLHHHLQPGRPAQRSMDAAVRDPQMWVRRIAMLHQLGWRLDADTDRLFGYAQTLAEDTDFFIRKAVGWALRDQARWRPQAVADFVAGHRTSLSALTVREATKHLGTGELSGTARPG